MKFVVLLLTICAMVVVIAAVGYKPGDGFPGYEGNIRFPEDEVIRWSEIFRHSITDLVRNLTALDHLTNEYNGYSNIKVINREELRDNIASEIEKLLQSKVENIERLVRHAEDVYENYTFDPELDYDFLNSKKLLSTEDMTHNQVFSVEEMSQKVRAINLSESSQFNYMPINNEISTVQVPTTVFDKSIEIMNGAYWTKELESSFKHNYERNESQTWQYFCSTDGFFRVFPGMKWPRDNKDMGIDFFDCRVRNWYLQGASGPKNVVILVDSSGSMKGLRMIIAQSTVKQILNTLDDDDYFNIIRFSDEVKYVDSCFNESLDLMAATKENKRRVTELIEEEVEAENQADFGKALEEVFNLFDNLEGSIKRRHGPLCNKAILLITDGVPEPQKTLFETRNWPDKRTRVFTFLIGRDVKDDRDVKWMACANKGYYSHISTLADVQENVQNYIKVLSRPMVINRDHNLVWTSLYLDHISSLETDKGLKFLTTVSMPVYDRKNETFREGNLLGVMGTDVPIRLIQQLAPTYKLGVNAYAFLINHNGYVMFHPDYRPYRTDPETGERILNPNYGNMDLGDVILPMNPQEFKEMRENMLEMAQGSKRLSILRHYDNMKRMVKRTYAFVYRTIMNNTFVFGLAIPTAFDERTNVDVIQSPLRETLNGSNVLIAPWRYCKSLDSSLKGKDRVDKLIQIFENVNLREKDCDESLLTDLRSDSVFTRHLHQMWIRNANNYRLRHGVELIFFGSKGGLTRYLQTSKDGTTPRFLENRTSTIESSYYRRAVESMERLASREVYNFTFTMINASPEGFNDSTSTVMITAPVIVRDKTSPTMGVATMGVAGVVGLEMQYLSFQKIFMDSHYGFRNMNCSKMALSCYIVDEHGYIMVGKFANQQNGMFFGQVEDMLMAELIRMKLFIGYNFTDYQGVCQIKAEDESRSGASFLLNPLKWVFRGLLWTITELALLLSHFSINDYYHRWKAFANDPSESDYYDSTHETVKNFCDFDMKDMKPDERLAYSQLSAVDCSVGNKVVGHRPCHHTFTLYHVDFNRLGPLTGYIKGCEYLDGIVADTLIYGSTQANRVDPDETAPTGAVSSGSTLFANTSNHVAMRCAKGDMNCTHRFRPVCRKQYAVSRINDTNLLSIVTSSDCQCPSYTYGFGLEKEEIQYQSWQKCMKRRQNRYRKKRRPCSDFSPIEDWRKCAGCSTVLSKLVFSVGLLLALLCT